MDNSYKFFRNEACRFFPCHKTENTEDFNCLFCFCPLYFLDDCGGNYINNNGIKDCSGCILPHDPGGYNFITKKIIAENGKRNNNM